MSINRTESITCPKCGKESPFTIWQSVNTDLDPEIREAVKDLSIFRFTCPGCGYTANVDYDFLYHQMRDKIMIQYSASDESAENAKAMFSIEKMPEPMKQLFGNIFQDNYLFRIVRSQNELREKIEIFDAGLDDRIIEIYKTFLLVNVSGQFPNAKEIDLFFLQIDGKNLIQVLADGKPAGTAEINTEIYEGLEKDFKSRLPDIRNDDPMINRDYAFRCFALMDEKKE